MACVKPSVNASCRVGSGGVSGSLIHALNRSAVLVFMGGNDICASPWRAQDTPAVIILGFFTAAPTVMNMAGKSTNQSRPCGHTASIGPSIVRLRPLQGWAPTILTRSPGAKLEPSGSAGASASTDAGLVFTHEDG